MKHSGHTVLSSCIIRCCFALHLRDPPQPTHPKFVSKYATCSSVNPSDCRFPLCISKSVGSRNFPEPARHVVSTIACMLGILCAFSLICIMAVLYCVAIAAVSSPPVVMVYVTNDA